MRYNGIKILTVLLALPVFFMAIMILWRVQISTFLLERVLLSLDEEYQAVSRFDSIEGNFISNLTVTGLHSHSIPGTASNFKADIKEIRLHYSLLDFRDGLNVFLQELHCNVSGANFYYEKNSLKKKTDAESDTNSFIPAKLLLPHIDLINGNVVYASAEMKTELKNFSVLVDPDGAKQITDFAFRADDVTYGHGSETIFHTPLEVNLSLSKEKLEVVSLQVFKKELIESCWVSLEGIPESRFDYLLRANLFGGSVALQGRVEGGVISSRMTTDNASLNLPVEEFFYVDLPYVRGNLTSELHGSYQFEGKNEWALEGVLNLDMFSLSPEWIPADISISLAAKHNEIYFPAASYSAGGNSIEIEEAYLPKNIITGMKWQEVLAESEGRFAIELNNIDQFLASREMEKEKEGRKKVPEHAFTTSGTLQGAIVTLEQFSFVTASTNVHGKDVFVGPLLAEKPVQEWPFEIAFTMESKSIEELQWVVGPFLHGWAGKFALTGEFSGPFKSVQGSMTAHGRQLFYNKGLIGDVTFNAQVLGEILSLQDLHVDNDGIAAQAKGNLNMGDWSLVDFKVTLDVEDEKKSVQALLPENVIISESSRAELALSGPVHYPDGTLVVDLPAIVVSGQKIEQLLINVEKNGDHLVLSELYGETPYGAITLAGVIELQQAWNQFQFTLEKFDFENDSGSLSLSEGGSGSFADKALSFDAMIRADDGGEIEIRCPRLAEKNNDFQLEATNITSRGWLNEFTGEKLYFAGLNLNAELKGDMQQPIGRFAGEVESVGMDDNATPIQGGFLFDYSDNLIKVENFTLQGQGENQITLHGSLPFTLGDGAMFPADPLTVGGKIAISNLEDVAFLTEPIGLKSGSIAAEVDVEGSYAKPIGRLLLKADALTFSKERFAEMEAPVNVNVEMALAEDQISITSFDVVSDEVNIVVEGDWKPEGGMFFSSESEDEQGFAGTIEAKIKIAVQDLDILSGSFEGIRRMEGGLQSEITMSGNLKEPEINGFFSTQKAGLRHSYRFPQFGNMDVKGTFDRTHLTLDSFKGEFGGAPFQLAGDVKKESEGIFLNLQLNGENLLLYRDSGLQIRANTRLELTGPVKQLLLGGDVVLTGGGFTKDYDFFMPLKGKSAPKKKGKSGLFSISSPPFNVMKFDIHFTEEQPFEFANNIARGTLRPELKLLGTGEIPFLVGTVYVDPSFMRLPAGRLDIRSGLISFPENEPGAMLLDFVGEAQLAGYQINVITQGPAEAPEITLSSSPPLPNEDLLLLLLTGQSPEQPGDLSKSSFNVALHVGKDFLGKLFKDADDSDGTVFLDHFELEYGRDVTKGGDDTLEASFLLGRTKEEKLITYYLTAEKDVYDDVNMGFKIVLRFK